jgi:hypothetical protein
VGVDMPWEYLDNKEFQIRYKVAYELISYITPPLMVLDLNCGKKAELRNYLSMQCRYFGNDILARDYIEDPHRVYSIKDTMVERELEKINWKPDCIVMLGDGAGDVAPNEHESPFARQVFVELINKYKPQCVLHESTIFFQKKYGVLSLVYNGIKGGGYEQRLGVDIHVGNSENFVNHRRFVLYGL